MATAQYSLGFQRPVGRRSYHNKPRLTGEVCVDTPQATIALREIADRNKSFSENFVRIVNLSSCNVDIS